MDSSEAAAGVQSLVAGPLVALLAVHESLTQSARAVTPDQHPAYDRLLAFAQSLGIVEVARCYGEWADLGARRAAYAAGLEPILSPVLRTARTRFGKRVTAADRADYERWLAVAMAGVERPAFAAAWSEGRALPRRPGCRAGASGAS